MPFDPPHLLCLGRLAAQKALDISLSAFKLLVRRFPKVRLIIAGDGPLRTELEHQARTLGIRDQLDGRSGERAAADQYCYSGAYAVAARFFASSRVGNSANGPPSCGNAGGWSSGSYTP